MPNERNNTWLPVALIAGALIVWMGFLAAGAYWAPVGLAGGGKGSEEGGQGSDFRKLWVVVATTGGFLLLWGFVLVRVQTKLRRRRAADAAVVSGGSGGGGAGR